MPRHLYGRQPEPLATYPSITENAAGYFLTLDSMHWFAEQYTGGTGVGPESADPRMAPLRAASHAGLPAAYVLTAEFDPLRDEGETYAARLHDAGVAVEVRRGLGHIHGGQMLTGVWEPARQWAADADAALAAALAATRVGIRR